MPLTPRLAAFALLGTLLTGCSGDDEPTDVAPTDSQPDSTEASESPTENSVDDPPAVVFYGGSGVSANACGEPTYVSVYEEFDVNQEVRLVEVALAGGGSLVGQAAVAPTSPRGPSDGTLVIDEKPGWGRLDNLPEWADRVPLRGRLVQPGTYALFAQLRVRPGSPLEAVDVSFSDDNTASSSRLDVSAGLGRAEVSRLTLATRAPVVFECAA